nr:hypothetical protein [Tanacetum cinerariifolium]
MRDEHLDTIPKTKSDEFIKSSVENLIPNPSEPEDDRIDENDCDPEEEIRLIEKLLNDSLLLPENESFDFDIPSSSRPFAKPSDDKIKPNSGTLSVKVVGDIFEQYVPIPRLLPTQPTLVSNQEKSPHLLSHQGLKAFQLFSKCPMMIYGGNSPVLDVPFLPSLTSSSMGGLGQAE